MLLGMTITLRMEDPTALTKYTASHVPERAPFAFKKGSRLQLDGHVTEQLNRSRMKKDGRK